MGLLKGLGSRLASTPEQDRAQRLRGWISGLPSVEQICICRPRTKVRVAGVVESIRVVPKGETYSLEVTVFDGTDRLEAVWLGRRRIAGIDLGEVMILEGMMAPHRSNLEIMSMVNPAYTLVPEADRPR
jgi:hypothetical protein